MIYQVIPPREELREWISHFWVGTWDAASLQANTSYYVIANTLTELVFGFGSDDRHPDLLFAQVLGHTFLPRRFAVDGFCQLLGVSFYAHALPAFFRIPPSWLSNEMVTPDVLLGYEGTLLTERMAMAAGMQQRIALLSDHVSAMVNRQQPQDRLIAKAIKDIKRSRGTAKIETLARDFCLSEKQFGRRFKAFSGFSPKAYSRIVRFESVLHNYPGTGNLTEMAYTYDYYDQAHFIHEFKSLAGFTPSDFRKLGVAQQ